MNSAANDREIVRAWMDKASSHYPHECWFTAAFLCENLFFNKQKMYRILNYLHEEKKVYKRTHFGYPHSWTACLPSDEFDV